MNILIIDDNEEITEVISFYCGKKNIDCKVVNDGKEGLETMRSNDEFDLILLDLAMPDFTGIDVLNSLKNDGLLESKNVVVMTASSDQNMPEEIGNSGVKGILRKLCSLDELAELMEKFCKTDWCDQVSYLKISQLM